MVATFYLSREYKVAMYKEAKTTKQDTNRVHGDKELLEDESRRGGTVIARHQDHILTNLKH